MPADIPHSSEAPKPSAEALLEDIVEKKVAQSVVEHVKVALDSYVARQNRTNIWLLGLILFTLTVSCLLLAFSGGSESGSRHPALTSSALDNFQVKGDESSMPVIISQPGPLQVKQRIIANVSALMATSDKDMNEAEALFAYKLFSKRLVADFSQPVGTYPENAKLELIPRDRIRNEFDEVTSSLLSAENQPMIFITRQEALITEIYNDIQSYTPEGEVLENEVKAARAELLRQTLGVAKIWVDQATMLATPEQTQALVSTYQSMQSRLVDRLDTSKP